MISKYIFCIKMVSEFISVITWIFCNYRMLLMGDFDTCIVLKCILIYETENLYFTFILIGIELHFDVRDWEPPLYSHIKIGSWYQIGVLPGIEIHFDNTPNLVYLDWLFPCIKECRKPLSCIKIPVFLSFFIFSCTFRLLHLASIILGSLPYHALTFLHMLSSFCCILH